MAFKDRPKFVKIEMKQAMIEAQKGKYVPYSTYRFSNGNQETYIDKVVASRPIFAGRR